MIIFCPYNYCFDSSIERTQIKCLLCFASRLKVLVEVHDALSPQIGLHIERVACVSILWKKRCTNLVVTYLTSCLDDHRQHHSHLRAEYVEPKVSFVLAKGLPGRCTQCTL